MVIAGNERTKHVNGVKTEDSGWLLSFNWSWCWWHHSNEAGLRAIQVGPLVLETWG